MLTVNLSNDFITTEHILSEHAFFWYQVVSHSAASTCCVVASFDIEVTRDSELEVNMVRACNYTALGSECLT